MTTFLLLLAADILLVALIIFLILYIRKLKHEINNDKIDTVYPDYESVAERTGIEDIIDVSHFGYSQTR